MVREEQLGELGVFDLAKKLLRKGCVQILEACHEEGMRKPDAENRTEPLNPNSQKGDLALEKSEEYV